MSQEPKPEVEQPGPVQPQQPEVEPQVISPQQQQAYDKMMSTLSKMNTKIEKVKSRIQGEQLAQKANKTGEMTAKIISSKENSEIITKENLLTDITESYQKVVIDVYSENGKLKKQIQEMAKMIHEQNQKIYAHTNREKQLIQENQQLHSEINRLKDDKLMMSRGQPLHHTNERGNEQDPIKKKTTTQNTAQNEEFDFWSMPQNDYAKKSKNFVQDSNLWVNQKEAHQSPFITEGQATAVNKKKK